MSPYFLEGNEDWLRERRTALLLREERMADGRNESAWVDHSS